MLPLNLDMQLHLNFPARFIQVPPFLQGFDEHSLISVNDQKLTIEKTNQPTCFASASIESRHAITFKFSSKVYTSSSVFAGIWWAFVDICKRSKVNDRSFFCKFCKFVLSVLQVLPVTPDLPLYLNFQARFLQIPSFLQGFCEHSLQENA